MTLQDARSSFLWLLFRQAVGIFGQGMRAEHGCECLAAEAVSGAGKILLRIVAARWRVEQAADGIVEHIVGEIAALMAAECLCVPWQCLLVGWRQVHPHGDAYHIKAEHVRIMGDFEVLAVVGEVDHRLQVQVFLCVIEDLRQDVVGIEDAVGIRWCRSGPGIFFRGLELIEGSRIADGSPLWFGVDISADRTHAAIGVCGKRPDDKWHVELAEYRSGTGWIVKWFQNAAPNYEGGMKVALQSKGAPIASMMEVIGAVDGVEIVECCGKDVAGWCGRMWDAVASCLPESETDATPVFHITQPALDLAANIAATRPMGDGAWAWDRNKSMEDISPLVAVTMALGAATQIKTEKSKLYASTYEQRGVLVV